MNASRVVDICGRVERLIAQRIAAGKTDEEAAEAGADLLANHLGTRLTSEGRATAVRVYLASARLIRAGRYAPPASTTTLA